MLPTLELHQSKLFVLEQEIKTMQATRSYQRLSNFNIRDNRFERTKCTHTSLTTL